MSFQSALPAAGTATTLSADHAGRTVKFTLGPDDLTVLDPVHGPEPVVIAAGNEDLEQDCRNHLGRLSCVHGIDHCCPYNKGQIRGHYTGAGTLVSVPRGVYIAYVVSPKLDFPIVVTMRWRFRVVDVTYNGIYYKFASSQADNSDGFTVDLHGNDITVNIL